MSEADVLIRQEGCALRITLNRPRQLNALTTEMCRLIREAIERAHRLPADHPDTPGVIVIDGAGERGLCGGGDIKAMVADVPRACEFLREEYLMDDAVNRSRIPVLGLMTGITMGGGIGLTGHARYRVVSEDSTLAMPETRIGIVPDVGGHLLLARAPGFLGEYYAISGLSFDASDALKLGFADVCVRERDRAELLARLSSGVDPHAALTEFADPEPGQAGSAADRERGGIADIQAWWDPLMTELNLSGVTGATARAQRLSELLEREPRAERLRETLAGVCPTSVAVTLETVRRTRAEQRTLRQVLQDDYRLLHVLTQRPDFAEGVRAQLIDKDRCPRWQPASLAEVDADTILAAPDVEPLFTSMRDTGSDGVTGHRVDGLQ